MYQVQLGITHPDFRISKDLLVAIIALGTFNSILNANFCPCLRVDIYFNMFLFELITIMLNILLYSVQAKEETEENLN